MKNYIIVVKIIINILSRTLGIIYEKSIEKVIDIKFEQFNSKYLNNYNFKVNRISTNKKLNYNGEIIETPLLYNIDSNDLYIILKDDNPKIINEYLKSKINSINNLCLIEDNKNGFFSFPVVKMKVKKISKKIKCEITLYNIIPGKNKEIIVELIYKNIKNKEILSIAEELSWMLILLRNIHYYCNLNLSKENFRLRYEAELLYEQGFVDFTVQELKEKNIHVLTYNKNKNFFMFILYDTYPAIAPEIYYGSDDNIFEITINGQWSPEFTLKDIILAIEGSDYNE